MLCRFDLMFNDLKLVYCTPSIKNEQTAADLTVAGI